MVDKEAYIKKNHQFSEIGYKKWDPPIERRWNPCPEPK